MRQKARWGAIVLGLTPFVFAATCGTTNLNGEVDPSKVTQDGETARANALACKEGTRAIPYTTGMPGSKLANFAGTLKTSPVVMVEYRCDRFVLLDECAMVEGGVGASGYGFARVPLVEETRSFKGSDEIKGNFRNLAVSGSASASQSVAMDLKLRTVGMMTSSANFVYRKWLDADACKNATHFIKKAQVGAFQLDTASARGLDLAVDVTGAGGAAVASEQARESGLAAGDWEACEKDGPESINCQVPIQLTLVPILDTEPPATLPPPQPLPPSSFCQPGQVFSGGKCTSPAAAAALGGYVCQPTDQKECSAQCQAGNAESCGLLGALLIDASKTSEARDAFKKGCDPATGFDPAACAGLGVILRAEDEQAAAAAFQKACEGGDGRGCYEQGVALQKSDEEAALEKFERSCDVGHPDGCARLGHLNLMRFRTRFDNLEDRTFYEQDVLPHLRVACAGASPEGCFFLAQLYESGEGLERSDPLEASSLYSRACDRGYPDACLKLGEIYLRGQKMQAERSPLEAYRLYWKACYGDLPSEPTLPDFERKMRNADGCGELGEFFGQGELDGIVPGDREKHEEVARTLLRESCIKGESARGCYFLAEAYDQPRFGFGRSGSDAVQFFTDACRQQDGDACFRLGMKYAQGQDVNKDRKRAAEFYDKSCRVNLNPRGCYEHAEILFEDGNEVGAIEIFQDVCQVKGFTRACNRGADRIVQVFKKLKTTDNSETWLRHAVEMYDKACVSALRQRQDFDWYTREARRKDALEACFSGGLVYENGWGVPPSPAEALIRFRKTCDDASHARSCEKAGDFFLAGKGTQKDVIQAERYLDRACEGLTAEARAEATRKAEETRKPFEEPEQVGACKRVEAIRLEASVARCSAVGGRTEDKRRACAFAGQGLLENRSNRDDAQAITFLTDACERGDNPSCLLAGERLIKDRDAKKRGEGVDMLRQACFEGAQPGAPQSLYRACAELGRLRMTGFPAGTREPLVSKDPDRALEFFKRSCAGGGFGCVELGELRRAQKSYLAAFSAFRHGCDLGDGAACYEMGVSFDRGMGEEVLRDREKARLYYEKSCLQGFKRACFRDDDRKGRRKGEGKGGRKGAGAQ